MIFLKKRHYWRHCDVICDWNIAFCKNLRLYLDSSREFSYKIGYNLYGYFMVFLVLNQIKVKFYAKIAKKWPKWRLYDVIMTSRWHLRKFWIAFLESSFNLLQDRMNFIFLSDFSQWSILQNKKKVAILAVFAINRYI